MLDDVSVVAINSQLLPRAERPDAIKLRANEDAAFSGCKIYGQGFLLESSDREALIAKDTANGERIFPYLGGQEINASPTQLYERYVISFDQMTLQQAERWPDLLSIVREKVKPERDTNKRENYRRLWWQFGEYRPGLFKAMQKISRCLVTSGISKHRVFTFVPSTYVFSHNLYVFPLDNWTAFAVLQSSVHIAWADHLSSGLETRGGYRPSDCFETFPFPHSDPRARLPEIEAISERLYAERAQYMTDTTQGLTQTYNRLKDPKCEEPRILILRALHEEMDRAVLDAYGWTDLTVPPYCPLSVETQRVVDQFQDALIDHLFVLNEERAGEEKRLGATKSQKPNKTTVKRTSNRKGERASAQSQLTFNTAATEES